MATAIAKAVTAARQRAHSKQCPVCRLVIPASRRGRCQTCVAQDRLPLWRGRRAKN